ncbi:unannotated protein [freshwater metagenome]|uniref:Unannotated protein n=1 Tax=freshwater metagenome TaxID=449393 RepID=A0A6J7UGX1_9ZZZZ
MPVGLQVLVVAVMGLVALAIATQQFNKAE